MTTRTATEHKRTSDRKLTVGLFCIVTIAAFEAMALITALPTITDEFHGDSLYGLTVAVNLLANVIVIVAAASAADRIGPGRPFIVCAAVFTVGLVVAGAAPNMGCVVLGRILQGAGVGGFTTLAYVSVSRGIHPDRQPAAFTAMSAGWVVPSLIAPAAAGWITDTFGWRWVFFGIIPMVALLAAFVGPMLAGLPASSAPTDSTATRQRLRQSITVSIGLGALLWGLTLDRWLLVAPLAIGGSALALPGLRRLFPPGTGHAAPGLPAVIAVRLTATMAFIGVESFLPLAADRVHHVGPIAQGMVIIGAAVTWTIGQWFAAKRHGKTSDRTLITIGFAALAVGIASSMVVIRPHVHLAVTFATWCVSGLGMGMLMGPTTVRAMSLAPSGEDGLVSSQIGLSDSVGFATMTGIGGATVALADRGVFGLSTAIVINAVGASTLAILGAVLLSRRVVGPRRDFDQP